jgi:nitroreductase
LASEFFSLVTGTRSIRDFKDEPLPAPVIHEIVEAGRRSGSAKNSQPWHFVVVQDRSTLGELGKCGKWANHLARAAMGVALITPDPFLRLTIPFDLGRAAQSMMLTAWSHGVGSVMATIYQNSVACDLLDVPSDYTIPWCISFGYPARNEDRPPRKGGRKSTTEVVHWDRW